MGILTNPRIPRAWTLNPIDNILGNSIQNLLYKIQFRITQILSHFSKNVFIPSEYMIIFK